MTRTSSLLFLFGLVILASLALYRTSNRVQELDHQLHGLNAAIEGEREHLHVLKAEWVYLANPARVEAAARKHLDLRPTAPHQVASLADLPALLPARGEAAVAASTAPVSKPIASIKSTLHSTLAAFIHRKPAAPAAVMAAADTGYLTDHIAIQRDAPSPVPGGDAIGTMLGQLSTARQ